MGRGLGLYPAIAVSMVMMAMFGVVLERGLFRPRPGRDVVLSSIVVSTGLTLILTSAAIVAFGLYTKSLPFLISGSFNVFGATVPRDRILAIGFSVVALLLLYAFLKRTRLGLAMVASAQNREGSFLKGINPNRMSMSAMAIGCALAALAGALAGSILQLQPYMGGLPMIKGLVIIVLGGLGSIPGAVIGGLILGLIDGIVPVFFSPAIASVGPCWSWSSWCCSSGPRASSAMTRRGLAKLAGLDGDRRGRFPDAAVAVGQPVLVDRSGPACHQYPAGEQPSQRDAD